jgi:hypothetical protein
VRDFYHLFVFMSFLCMAQPLPWSMCTAGESEMNARQRSLLINLNRVLIVVLTLGGLLMDGLQPADLLCTVALFVWLWLPLCTRLEARLLHWVDGRRGSARPAGTSPSI